MSSKVSSKQCTLIERWYRRRIMGCCMRNCYGTSIDDLNKEMKMSLPLKLALYLINLAECSTNNLSQKNALANFNSASIFAGSALLKKIADMDRNGDRYDLSTTDKLVNSLLPGILSDFDRNICNGYGQELIDLDDKYNSGNNKGDYGLTFPGGLSDSQKNSILDLLGKNNNYNDNRLDNLGNNNLVVYDSNNSGSGLNKDTLYDDLFNNSGNNPLINIPDDELLNLQLNKRFFTCFVPEFDLNNYLFFDKKDRPLITSNKIANIKKIHNEILLPIYNHYYGSNSAPSCQIKIVFGIGGLKNTIVDAGGTSFSRHLRGEAVDFSMVGVSGQKLIADLKSGALRINFGVLSLTNGIHITLPYTYEDLDIRGMILASPRNSRNSLKVDFIF